MTATFPNDIASFTQKRDNQDVNYAADINRLQDEIVAIESVLGSLINEVQDDETNDRTKFKNLGDRLKWLQSGYHIRAVHASASNILIPNVATPKLSTSMNVIKMSKPSADQDPYGLFNGTGFTLDKAGFWLLTASVNYDTGDQRAKGGNGSGNFDTATKSPNAGVFQAGIDVDGVFSIGIDRQESYTEADALSWLNISLLPHRMSWFSKGTKVTLKTAQSSSISQRIWRADLSAVWFRSPGQPSQPSI